MAFAKRLCHASGVMVHLYRRLWVFILLASAVFELAIAVVLLVRPEIEAAQFHIAITPDTLSLAQILAEFAIFLALICGIAAWKALKGDPAARLLSLICGLHWAFFGVFLYFRYYEAKFLAMDTVRGVCLLVLPYLIARAESVTGTVDH
jgi:hypothetical protein